MNIILLENIDKVGGKFEVVTVKNGYGRNYLIPQGKALIANDTNMRRLEDYRKRESKRMEKMLGEFQAIAETLSSNKFHFEKILTNTTPRLDKRKIDSILLNMTTKETRRNVSCYLCGPKEFATEMKSHLVENQIPENQVPYEAWW